VHKIEKRAGRTSWDIDFHIHTNCSDGQMPPEEIVRQASTLGYRAIAITDHDGTDGLQDALEAGKKQGIQVIPGIEFATETEEHIGLHILGYGMNWKAPAFQDAVRELAHRRRDRNERLLAVLADLGYELSLEDLQKQQPNGYVGRPIIARALVAKGYLEKPKDAFREGRFLGSPQAKAVKRVKIQAVRAIDLIREAGGIAVLAHPIQTRGIGETGSEAFYQRMGQILGDLKEAGLSGLECYHPDQSREQSARFLQLAEQFGFCISRGSDFHGSAFSGSDLTAERLPGYEALRFVDEVLRTETADRYTAKQNGCPQAAD